MVVIFSLNLQNTSEKFPFGIGSYKAAFVLKQLDICCIFKIKTANRLAHGFFRSISFV